MPGARSKRRRQAGSGPSLPYIAALEQLRGNSRRPCSRPSKPPLNALQTNVVPSVAYPYPPIIAALKPILRASIEAAPTGGVMTVGREGRTPLHKEPPFDLSPIRRDRTIHVSASPIKKGSTPNPPGSHTTWILFFYEALPPWAHTPRTSIFLAR